MIYPDIYPVGLNVASVPIQMRSPKLRATLLLTVRGTPVMYYGQEIGMVDLLDIPEDKIRDSRYS